MLQRLILGGLVGAMSCEASFGATFGLPPTPNTQRDSLPLEEEKQLIEIAASLPDVRTRVRRLFWHLINHNRHESPLKDFVADRLFSPDSEAWLSGELQRMAAALVARQNLDFYAGGYWLYDSPRVHAIPAEFTGGKSGADSDAHLSEQFSALRQREGDFGYGDRLDSAYGQASFLASVRRDATVRVLAPLLFYECRTWSMGDYPMTSPADAARSSLMRIAPRGMPRYDATREQKETAYNYLHELQNWWIAHAHEFGATPPPPELVAASRRLHEPLGTGAAAMANSTVAAQPPFALGVRRPLWAVVLLAALVAVALAALLRSRLRARKTRGRQSDEERAPD